MAQSLRHLNSHYTVDYEIRMMLYNQTHAAWENGCNQLTAEYEQVHAD